MANSKVEICLKKKTPPRAQIFRYFCYESRKKNKWALLGIDVFLSLCLFLFIFLLNLYNFVAIITTKTELKK